MSAISSAQEGEGEGEKKTALQVLAQSSGADPVVLCCAVHSPIAGAPGAHWRSMSSIKPLGPVFQSAKEGIQSVSEYKLI